MGQAQFGHSRPRVALEPTTVDALLGRLFDVRPY
jgi:hypothetical protein